MKRRLDLPQNRQETSSGASAATDGGSPFRERIVYSCWGEIVFLRLGVSSFSSLDLEIVFLRIKSVFLGRKVYSYPGDLIRVLRRKFLCLIFIKIGKIGY